MKITCAPVLTRKDETQAYSSGFKKDTLAVIGVTAALVSGMVLRLIWPWDIEYKLDESQYFEIVQTILAGGSWPWLGPPASIGVPAPAGGEWVLAAIGFLAGANSPPELARGIQLLNIAAVCGLGAFAMAAVPAKDREPWLWAMALWALNPVAIVLERKIWPVSTLPAFTIILIAAWWCRGRFAGAFGWGLVGSLMGQVHVAAALFVLSLALWTAIADRKVVHWVAWLIGTVLGAILLVPWLIEAVAETGHALRWRWPNPSFYLRWLTQPFGLGLEYTLGRYHLQEFLRGPDWSGRPIYLIGLLYGMAALLLLTIATRALLYLRRFGYPPLRVVFLGNDPAALLIRATLWGYGGMLTLITAVGWNSHRHYLIVAAPIMALWAAQAVMFCDPKQCRRAAHCLLSSLCVVQAALSLGLLAYIHSSKIIYAEYGPTWSFQQLHCRSTMHADHAGCLRSLLGKN